MMMWFFVICLVCVGILIGVYEVCCGALVWKKRRDAQFEKFCVRMEEVCKEQHHRMIRILAQASDEEVLDVSNQKMSDRPQEDER